MMLGYTNPQLGQINHLSLYREEDCDLNLVGVMPWCSLNLRVK